MCGASSPYVRDDGQEGGITPCSSEKASVCKTCPDKMFSLAPVWPELKESSKRAHACAPCHSFPAVFQTEAGSSSTADKGSMTICISSPVPVFFFKAINIQNCSLAHREDSMFAIAFIICFLLKIISLGLTEDAQ